MDDACKNIEASVNGFAWDEEASELTLWIRGVPHIVSLSEYPRGPIWLISGVRVAVVWVRKQEPELCFNECEANSFGTGKQTGKKINISANELGTTTSRIRRHRFHGEYACSYSCHRPRLP
jgi:hypothetical protein